MYISYSNKIKLNVLDTFNCGRSDCCPIWAFYIGCFFFMTVSFTCQDLQIFTALLLIAQNAQKRLSNMINARKGNTLGFGYINGAVGPYYFNNETARIVDYHELRTLTSG